MLQFMLNATINGGDFHLLVYELNLFQDPGSLEFIHSPCRKMSLFGTIASTILHANDKL